MKKNRIAIIGAGNIGIAIAHGLVESNSFVANNITLTRRKIDQIKDLKKNGFIIDSNNKNAVLNSEIIIIAVEPKQINEVLSQIS